MKVNFHPRYILHSHILIIMITSLGGDYYLQRLSPKVFQVHILYRYQPGINEKEVNTAPSLL